MEIEKEKHAKYFLYCLKVLPRPYLSLDTTRVTVVYFCLSGLDILGALDRVTNKQEIVEWLYSLQIAPGDSPKKHGGFRGSPFLGRRRDHPDQEIPYDYANSACTYTALACLLILGDDLSRVNKEAILEGLRHLQQPNGSFCSVYDGSESDMRFVYTAAVISYILNDWSGMNVPLTLKYIAESQGYDGGIAQEPWGESHGGSTFCAVATLVLMGWDGEQGIRAGLQICDAQLPDKEAILRWSLLRQETGFQGRPCKPVDTCYSFWLGASIKLLGGYSMVDHDLNRKYVLGCQGDTGGFSKWADTYADILHSYMGLAGLSLAGLDSAHLEEINPALNITKRAEESLKRSVFWKNAQR